MEISPSAITMSVLLYNFYEMPGEKAWWELHKDAEWCFKQILEAAPNKTAAAQLLDTDLTNLPSK